MIAREERATMSNGTKIVMLFLALLMLLTVPIASAEERSFEISEVAIHATIDAEGNMHVTERDTYVFQGIYNGIMVNLNRSGSDGIEQFAAYEVVDGGNVPLTFEQAGNGEELQYRIFSRSVDTTKVFQFSYTVKNAVQVYADTAELYWKFFDETNDNPLSMVNIEIELPEGRSKDEITAFGHGPLSGTIVVQEDGRVHYEVDVLAANQLLETRVLFPTEYVSASGKISDEPMLQHILEEERNWQSQQSNNDYTVPWAALLLFINLAAGFTVYIRYRRHPASDWKRDYYRELPSDSSPAVIGFLMNLRVESSDLMATMLDFVRKTYIDMQKLDAPIAGKEKHDYMFFWKNKQQDGLQPHEGMLLKWFFREIGKGNQVSFSEIKANAAIPGDFSGKWSEWQGKVKEAAIERKLVKKNSGIYRWVLFAFLVQFFGFLFLAPADWKWLMFCAIPLPFFVPRRYQRTKEGQIEYEKWRAFGRFLRAYNRIEKHNTMAVHRWDPYFVYAIPLGAAKRMIKETKVSIQNTKNSASYYDGSTLYGSTAVREYDQVTRLFRDTVTESTKSTSDDSSDSGGGFSSGGGGGGGGGRGAF